MNADANDLVLRCRCGRMMSWSQMCWLSPPRREVSSGSMDRRRRIACAACVKAAAPIRRAS